MPDYPEHDKVHAVKDRSQACGEFLDWLGSKGIFLCKAHEHSEGCYDEDDDRQRYPGCGLKSEEMFPHGTSVTKLLAEFFEIDLNKLEEEKMAMLEVQRKLNRRAG